MDAYTRTSSTGTLSGGYSTFKSSGSIEGNSSGSMTVQPAGNTSFQNVLDGYRNPRWRDQVRLGQSATTPLSGTFFRSKPVYVNIFCDYDVVSVSNPRQTQHETYSFQGFITLTQPQLAAQHATSAVITEATNRCIKKFIAKVNEARSSGNLTGRSLRHLKHDLHSVVSPMPELRRRIVNYLEEVMKLSQRRRPSPRQLLRDIRAAYLQFDFGLRPFSEDLTSVLLDISRKRDFDVIPVQGSGKVRYFGANSALVLSTPVGYAEIFQPTWKFSVASEYSVRYKGAVRTGRDASGRVGWFQDNRLLPRDWAPTLVSILPYDWLVNYFVNVNDLVDGLSFVFADLAWANGTTRDVTTWTMDNLSLAAHATTYWPLPTYKVLNDDEEVSGGATSYEKKTITRWALTPSDLVPSLTFKVPTRPTQYVNMLAALYPRLAKVIRSLT